MHISGLRVILPGILETSYNLISVPACRQCAQDNARQSNDTMPSACPLHSVQGIGKVFVALSLLRISFAAVGIDAKGGQCLMAAFDCFYLESHRTTLLQLLFEATSTRPDVFSCLVPEKVVANSR